VYEYYIDTSLQKGTKRSQLFASSSGDDSDSDDSDDEQDKARFNIKQQFEGTAGRKVTLLFVEFDLIVNFSSPLLRAVSFMCRKLSL